MAQYVDKSLAADETIVMRGRWPWIYWFWAWAALVVLGVFIIGIVIFAVAAVRMTTTEFVVTDQRVILKRGFIRRQTNEIAVRSVEGANLMQSFWGRILGYGRLIVTGTGDARIEFPPMADPVGFRRAIENGRTNDREVHLAREDREAIREAAADEDAPPGRRRA
ncbi:MAG: PH domain-containing protein [Alphaproteobacteria bacterium]|nr:PH domain-containing protein [Alphaproteobacteria bacterium]